MHLALYRKYRSATFDEVISQEHITTTLKNQIKAGTPAHAYLFTGSRGTGKTTCAKLMAKAVNCLSPVDGNPCGECESCKAIAAGCPDIIEMDAASNNGVDDVRALRDEVMYAPTVCRYKVYIIDEVHMLSSQALNHRRTAAARYIHTCDYRDTQGACDYRIKMSAVPLFKN